MSPNDPKLSDGGGWRDGCAGEGGGAASVTAGAVRCSAWLAVAGLGCWSFIVAVGLLVDVGNSLAVECPERAGLHTVFGAEDSAGGGGK